MIEIYDESNEIFLKFQILYWSVERIDECSKNKFLIFSSEDIFFWSTFFLKYRKNE